MGEFGPYEKVEQIDLAGFVWTARKEGDASAQFVLKFCAAPGEGLRSAAELQKKLAEGKGAAEGQPAYWGAIHHVGVPAKGGAYYITDQYKWSAQLVYDQKDRFTSGGLYRLIRGAALALGQITAAYGRGHGNLKRSNILLTERNLDRATVVLCDPVPPNSPELTDPNGDRRAVGRILFELVTGQEFKDFLYPVRGQKKWEALGPDGPRWLEWCNRLLAPANDPTACTLDDFRKQLDAFSPGGDSTGKKAPVKLIAAAAVGLVAIGGIAFFALHGTKPAQVATNTPAPSAVTPAPTPQPSPMPTPAPTPAAPPSPPREVAPAPAPAPPPAVVQEPDPRGGWGFSDLAAALRQRDQLAGSVRQIKQTFKDIPGVAEAVSDVPAVADPTASIQGLTWPADQATINAKKGDLDAALAQARQIIASDPVGTAWRQAWGSLRAIKFRAPAVQDVWNKLTADPRLAKGYSADQFPVGFPEAYARLSALDQAAGQAESRTLDAELVSAVTDKSPTPQSLVADMGRRSDAIRANQSVAAAQAGAKAKWDTARATTFTHAAVSQGFQTFTASLGSLPPDQAVSKAQPVIDSLRDIDNGWPAGSPVDNPAVTDQYQKKVNQAAASALAAIVSDPANGGKAAQDFKDQIAGLNKQAVAVAGAMKTVAAATAELSAPDTLDPAKWQALADRLGGAAAVPAGWPDTGAAAALAQSNAVVSALSAARPDQLLSLAGQGQPKALMLAVCQRWMSLHGDPDLDYQIFGAVKAGLGQVPDTVRADLGRVWLKRVEDSPKDADHLWDLYQKMGLDPALPSRQFNSLLAGLQSHVQDGKLRPDQAKDFLAQTKPLANDKIPGGARIAEINEKLSRLIPTGPAAAAHAGGLPAGFRRDGDDLIRDDAAYPMRFVPIPANGSVHSYYLCTTDVPVGWFIGIASAPRRQAMMQRLMKIEVPRLQVGPVAWMTDGNGWIRPKGGNDPWLTNDPLWGKDLAGALQPPSARMPMQYVSPLAAMYAASLAGCRLPTAAEWIDAYQDGRLRAGNENASGPNYADLVRQIKAIQPPTQGEKRYLQHFQDELDISQFQGAIGQGGTQLWFRELAPQPDKLQDMAGNVSDWVFDADPAPVSAKFDEAGGSIQVSLPTGAVTAQDQDEATLAEFYNHCQRIGLSSTSDNTVAPATATNPPKDKAGKLPHHHQFFDVGFRLALDDPNSAGGTDAVAAYVMELRPIQP